MITSCIALVLTSLAIAVQRPTKFDPADYWREQQRVWLEQQKYQAQVLMDYLEGAQMLAEGNGSTPALQRVVRQLEEFSGMSFRVVPMQTGNWGQAHYGGLILLDISVIGLAETKPAVFAFVLAHEWGHEALGHQPNYYNVSGPQQVWTFRPTDKEDAADSYAGWFLARENYNIEEVTKHLSEQPENPADIHHSKGPARAKLVEEAYRRRMRRSLNSAALTAEVSIRPIMPGGAPTCVGIWCDNEFMGMVHNSEWSQAGRSVNVRVFRGEEHQVVMRAVQMAWHPQTGFTAMSPLMNSQPMRVDRDTAYVVGSWNYPDLRPVLRPKGPFTR